MTIKYSSCEVRHVYRFQSVGKVKLIADNGGGQPQEHATTFDVVFKS